MKSCAYCEQEVREEEYVCPKCGSDLFIEPCDKEYLSVSAPETRSIISAWNKVVEFCRKFRYIEISLEITRSGPCCISIEL